MNQLNLQDVTQYVEQNIGTFHQKRIESLQRLRLESVLLRKNPYLFKAKHSNTAETIVTTILDAHISSAEETIFGDWLEGLAIFINEKVYGGRKSGIDGIDLEFDKDGVRYIVTIKSGPNWANSKQLKAMRAGFVTAQKVLRTSNSKVNVRAVNGCCYGRENRPDKGDHFKYCGQVFWEFISNDPDLYTNIIEPLGHLAAEKNAEYRLSYERVVNLFTGEFLQKFCDDGMIQWERLVKFNSSAEALPKKVREKKEKVPSPKRRTEPGINLSDNDAFFNAIMENKKRNEKGDSN